MWILSIVLVVLLYVLGNSKFFFIALIFNAVWLLIIVLSPEPISILSNRPVKNPFIFYLLIGVLIWTSLDLYPSLALINNPQPPLLNQLKKIQGTITWRQRPTQSMRNPWFILKTNKGEKNRFIYRKKLNTKHAIKRAINDKQPVKIWYSNEKVAPLQVPSDKNFVEQIEINGKFFLKYDYLYELEQYENRYSNIRISATLFVLSLISLVGGYLKNEIKKPRH